MYKFKFLWAAVAAIALCSIPSASPQTHVFPATDTNNVFTGTNQFTIGHIDGPAAFVSLPTETDGTTLYCPDCKATVPCTGAGTGAVATGINGAWSCGVSFNNPVFTGTVTFPITGLIQCLHVSTAGVVSGTGTDCGSSGAPVLITPVASQNVIQPSVGGLVTPGTSLNVNSFEQIRYADQFQWLQSPAGTVAVGANTITINQVRGISTYSCISPGTGCAGNFGGVGTTHYIWVGGTGTPEAVRITGTTCTGATTGTCTVTFTATTSHTAGYTLGTATAGFMEALVDSYSLATSNPTTGREISCSPWPTSAHFVIRATIFVDGFDSTLPGRTYFEGHGCVLEDAVSGGPMLKATGSSYVTFEHFTLATSTGVGRAANGTQVFIYDVGQLFHFSHNGFACPSSGCGTDVVDRVIEVNADQGATIDHNDFEGVPMKCDTTWCGAMVYGDPVSNAAIGDVHDNYFSNNQDPLLWESGNGLTIKDNVFQNWVHYPWKYRGGLLAVTNQGGNYYEGNCSLINPDFGMVGFSCNTGPQVATSGSQVEYKPLQDRNGGVNGYHSFAATGANIYTYYIVGHVGGTFTRPLLIGTASSDGVTPIPLYWLKFGATTYDVLVAGPRVGDGTDTSPYGTANWAVTTGVTCSVNPCTFTDTFAARSSYSVNIFAGNSYTPAIDYWPVPLYMHGSLSSPSIYIGPAVGLVSGNAINQQATYYDAIFTSEAGGEEYATGMRVLRMMPIGDGGTGNNPGAMILNPDVQQNSFSGRKGRINMPSASQIFGQDQFIHDNCAYQSYDPDSDKTFATPGHQPLLNASGLDVCMGYDIDMKHLAFSGGLGINFYAGHKFDSGVSPIFGISSTGLTVNKGLSLSAGSGYQAIRTVAGCTTAASLAATCTTTVTWTTAFANANYTPHCDGVAITSGVPLNGGITAQVAASVTFQTVSATAVAAKFTNIVCSAFHD